VFRPTEPPALADGTAVELTVTPLPAEPPVDELEQRIRSAGSLQELWAAIDAAAAEEPDDGYDLLQALNRNRLEAGWAPLFPPPDEAGP
jgi:hypothetical protein